VHLNSDAALNKLPDGRLDIERISAEAVDRVDTHGVTFTYVPKEFGEARTLRRNRESAHAGVEKFFLEVAAESCSLALYALISCTYAEVCDAAH
jgi:hypothetical protein